MEIALLHKGSFRALPGATARRLSGNAFEVRIPRSAESERLMRGKWSLESLDDAVLLLGDDESVQVLGSREEPDALVVTALI